MDSLVLNTVLCLKIVFYSLSSGFHFKWRSKYLYSHNYYPWLVRVSTAREACSQEYHHLDTIAVVRTISDRGVPVNSQRKMKVHINFLHSLLYSDRIKPKKVKCFYFAKACMLFLCFQDYEMESKTFFYIFSSI